MSASHLGLDDQAVAAALRQALLEVHMYQSAHASDNVRHESIEALAALGVLSSPTLAFLKNHEARFFGLPQRMANDIAVFEIVFADRRFVGFSDGHVEREAHENKVPACS